MSKFVKVLIAAGMLAATGCSYGAVTMTPEGKALVVRQDAFLYGVLRKIFICDVNADGLSGCKESAEKP